MILPRSLPPGCPVACRRQKALGAGRGLPVSEAPVFAESPFPFYFLPTFSLLPFPTPVWGNSCPLSGVCSSQRFYVLLRPAPLLDRTAAGRGCRSAEGFFGFTWFVSRFCSLVCSPCFASSPLCLRAHHARGCLVRFAHGSTTPYRRIHCTVKLIMLGVIWFGSLINAPRPTVISFVLSSSS